LYIGPYSPGKWVFFLSHFGRFSRGKKGKKVRKRKKKEEKRMNGKKNGNFFKMNGTIYIPVLF